MKQTDEQAIKEAQELLDEIKAKRSGGIVEVHKKMANDPGLVKAYFQALEICNLELKHIPRKYRELIAFAVGCAKNEPKIINAHGKMAIDNGATADEVGEVLRMIFMMCGTTGLLAGLDVFEPIDYE